MQLTTLRAAEEGRRPVAAAPAHDVAGSSQLQRLRLHHVAAPDSDGGMDRGIRVGQNVSVGEDVHVNIVVSGVDDEMAAACDRQDRT